MNSKLLQPLFDAGRLWQGQSSRTTAVWSSGHPALDRQLVGGGWPAHGLLECLTELPSTALFSLWLPVWQQISSLGQGLGLLNPSYQLSAEGLQQQAISPQVVNVVRCARDEQAWTLEQLVRSGTLASILCCAEAPYQTKQLRRLHLAAQDVGCQLVIIRHSAAGNLPSPAPTRWSLTRDSDGLHLHVSKQAGRPPVTLCVPTSPNRPLACPPARRRVALLDTKTLQ